MDVLFRPPPVALSLASSFAQWQLAKHDWPYPAGREVNLGAGNCRCVHLTSSSRCLDPGTNLRVSPVTAVSAVDTDSSMGGWIDDSHYCRSLCDSDFTNETLVPQ